MSLQVIEFLSLLRYNSESLDLTQFRLCYQLSEGGSFTNVLSTISSFVNSFFYIGGL